MKKTITKTEEIEVCDFCYINPVSTCCFICGKQACQKCKSIEMNTYKNETDLIRDYDGDVSRLTYYIPNCCKTHNDENYIVHLHKKLENTLNAMEKLETKAQKIADEINRTKRR
jgi:hypothetical protein